MTTSTISRRRQALRLSSFIAAAVGLLASAALYYGWTLLRAEPPPTAPPHTTRAQTPPAPAPVPIDVPDAQGPLSLDARLGSPYLRANEPGETYISVTIRAPKRSVPEAPPAQLTLVIDRSGSMAGDRLRQAKAAAQDLVRGLRDGDRIAVVVYDANATVIVPSTVLSSSNRDDVLERIRGVYIGSSTCIVCGLQAAERELHSGSRGQTAHRVVLLSDGKPDGEEKALPAIQKIVQRLEQLGVTISTIGVGLLYNEALMARIAISGNGNHYFAETSSRIAETLESELIELRQIAARRASVTFELAPGVRFKKGFDRVFQAKDGSVRVSLGDIPVGTERTVLMQLALDHPTASTHPITRVVLRYDDLIRGGERSAAQALSVTLTDDDQLLESALDADVAARVEQTEIIETVIRVNEVLKRGDVQGAKRILQKQRAKSALNNEHYQNERLNKSIQSLIDMEQNLDAPAASSPEGLNRAMKGNASAYRMMMH